jgi:hypothetical protein
MSTDWIKMRVDLRTHPKVVRMASALKADKLRVIGGLFAVWAIFDAHSVDGALEGYTLAAVDEELGWRGFGASMQAIGWLVDDEDGLIAPRFGDHNGASAKRRALDNDRKKSSRSADPTANGSWNKDGQMSACDADRSRTREEKRREEKEIPPKPPEGFVEFWDAWPKTVRKGGKAECERVWRQHRLEAMADTIVEHVRAMTKTEGWAKQGGDFVPAPVVYLRGKRWDGADLNGATHPDDVFAGAH